MRTRTILLRPLTMEGVGSRSNASAYARKKSSVVSRLAMVSWRRVLMTQAPTLLMMAGGDVGDIDHVDQAYYSYWINYKSGSCWVGILLAHRVGRQPRLKKEVARDMRAIVLFFAGAAAQQVGKAREESHLAMPIQHCDKANGCKWEKTSAVLDSNWRCAPTPPPYPHPHTRPFTAR